MTKLNLLQANQSYTFRSYFEMPYEVDQILAEFDYQFIADNLTLPRSDRPLDRLSQLQDDIQDSLRLTLLSSETARREVMIAPILLMVARLVHCPIRLEYPLNVNQWLKGNLDYFLRSPQNLLVVEAKNDDLTRGFTQLAVEMIALSEAEDQAIVYGVVTIGSAWQFGKLDRPSQSITQDINLYSVPSQLEFVIRILLGITEAIDSTMQ